MADVFEQIESTLRRLLAGAGAHHPMHDPDYAAAWQELQEFLGNDNRRPDDRTDGAPDGQGEPELRREMQQLQEDYRVLEAPFMLPEPQLRERYKTLLQQYHPDRFAANAEHSQIANEVTARLNAAYRRIITVLRKHNS